MDIIMKLSKKFYSIVAAGLLAFSNVSHAADPVIYDFGTLLTASEGYTAPNTASFAVEHQQQFIQHIWK